MENTSRTPFRFLKFFGPSLCGILLFLVPVPSANGATLIINIIINKTKELMGETLIPFVLLVLTVSAICSVVGYVKKDAFKGYFAGLFRARLFDVLIRVTAAALAFLIYFQAGPEAVWSKNTGGMMMNEVVANLIPFFLWAGLFLPFLTEFGLMEFIGNLMWPVMRPLFKLPGRSAVNCAVAWVGSGTMGIALTNREYEAGYYTRKEAVVIATGFSIASIAIVSLLCSFLDMTPHFPKVYLACILIGFIINMLIARIPPVKNMGDGYCRELPDTERSESVPAGSSFLRHAVQSAEARAEKPKGNLVVGGLKFTGDIWFTLEPVVLTIGTLATIVVEYTPIVAYLSRPLGWLVGLLGLPEAAAAGESILLGFVDVFLPFITGGSIAAPITKFVIAVVCVLQIIFITETGPMLLKVKLGLKFHHIVIIFLMRTVMALLLATPVAYLLF